MTTNTKLIAERTRGDGGRILNDTDMQGGGAYPFNRNCFYCKKAPEILEQQRGSKRFSVGCIGQYGHMHICSGDSIEEAIKNWNESEKR